MNRLIIASCAAVATTFSFEAGDAHAIRPFITDDARVVGTHLAQLETWVQVDRQGLQHWALPAFGPTSWLELTAGGLHGWAGDATRAHSVGGPLLQAKALVVDIEDGGAPGFAIASGALLPGGTGAFERPRTTWFGYGAITGSWLSGRLLLHANVGLGHAERAVMTAGLAGQAHLWAGLYAVGEFVRGDALSGTRDGAVQGGLRFAFSESVQVDVTTGAGVWGDDRRPAWVTLGLRLASAPLW